MTEQPTDVYLYVYDLSGGLAVRLSMMFIGKQLDGIWHTGVVIYGKEYYFGSTGICCSLPGSVVGEPLRKLHLGETHIPEPIFEEFIFSLGDSEFRGSSYNLLNHNCNNFSETVCQFLLGKSIPKYILDLPEEILNTPFGHTFRGLLDNISRNSPSLSEVKSLNEGTPHDPSKSIFENTVHSNGEVSMSEEGHVENSTTPAQLAEQIADEERKEKEEKRRNREPPVVFKDAIDVPIEFDKLVGLIENKLSEEEQLSLEELHQYMFQDEGSWALGDNFLVFIGRLLTDSSLGAEVSVCTLNILAAAALKDDIILMLHQDRKHHILMNYAYDIDRMPLSQQKGLALFICNLFENSSSSEWMLYISEWLMNTTSLSNIRVTTKVAVQALLSDDSDLVDRGSAIVYNLATKEVKTVVFDDVAVELSLAILQFLGGSPPEAQVYRCLKALVKFSQIASQDVPQLIQMIGPHPSKFKGQSERNDNLIEEISKRIR